MGGPCGPNFGGHVPLQCAHLCAQWLEQPGACRPAVAGGDHIWGKTKTCMCIVYRRIMLNISIELIWMMNANPSQSRNACFSDNTLVLMCHKIALSQRAVTALLFIGAPLILLLVSNHKMNDHLIVGRTDVKYRIRIAMWYFLLFWFCSHPVSAVLRLHACDYVSQQVEGGPMDKRARTPSL